MWTQSISIGFSGYVCGERGTEQAGVLSFYEKINKDKELEQPRERLIRRD